MKVGLPAPVKPPQLMLREVEIGLPHPPLLKLQNREQIIDCCCSKPLTLRVVGYPAIDSWNTSFTLGRVGSICLIAKVECFPPPHTKAHASLKHALDMMGGEWKQQV